MAYLTNPDYRCEFTKIQRHDKESAPAGRPVTFKPAMHKSKKVYDRKCLKRTDIYHEDDCPFRLKCVSSYHEVQAYQ